MLRDLLILCLAAGGVVLVLLALNMASVPRLSRAGRRAPPGRWPLVSVVIPARNEEQAIEATIRSHFAQDYPLLEVVVVEDCSTDRTGEILAGLAGEDGRLRILTGLDPPPGWLGKPHALYRGSRAARGELILFADADVRYHPRALREAVTVLEGQRLDFLAVIPRFEMEGFWENVLMPNIPLTYFFGPGLLANADRVRFVAAGGGAGNLVRSGVYAAVGGHEALSSSVIDDVHLAFLVKKSGFRCRAFRAEDRVSVRMYRGFRQVWDGFTKNVAYAFQGPLGTLLITLMLLAVVPALLPALVLLAALFGAPVGTLETRLAAAGLMMSIAARTPVALALKHPLWTTATNPLMVAVWAGIIVRSSYWRFVRKEVRWRGRTYESRHASF